MNGKQFEWQCPTREIPLDELEIITKINRGQVFINEICQSQNSFNWDINIFHYVVYGFNHRENDKMVADAQSNFWKDG